MYLKNNFKNVNGNLIVGKVIKNKKLIKILKEFSGDILLNCNDVSNNINIFIDEDLEDLTQLGYIDIGEEEYIEF